MKTGCITCLLTVYLSVVHPFSINDCLDTKNTFCFGAKGNDTSNDPRCGCLGNNDCDVLVSGVIISGGQKEDDSILIDWDIKLRRIDLTENQIRRVHFYVSKSNQCVQCNLKENSLFVPVDVMALDVHRQKRLSGQPLSDNLQVILNTRNGSNIEKVEIRNPEGSFHINDTMLKYEGEGENNRTFVTVSFESSEKLYYEHNFKRIYDVNLRKDEVYPGIVSMIETLAPQSNLVSSVMVTTNVVGSKVKLFDPNRLKDTQTSRRSPWLIALIVALVLLVIVSCLCCCYCWRKKKHEKELQKIHANYT